ncbi:Gfo/Idh/MocA family protein [Streptomyces naphthomycinicus]|uniref:Gfo/Idh/MocA family protein n=1 Tax=Streptomyces naphthomycinicus TaxID=2872625 RepID=UPI001CECACB4|nr:Gfo/Idh/MocA family oxidoreductase [Streptomyces sp. TML10]
MRVGVVGCGQIVEQGHLPVLLRTPGLHLTGLVDLVPERARRLAGQAEAAGRPVPAYRDTAELVERARPDLVLLATPPSVRSAELRTLGEAGVAVLCEKPLANSVEEADALLSEAARTGARVFMTHNYAFFPEYRLLARLVGEGHIGPVRSVLISCLGSYPWDGAEEFRPGWRHDRALSGGGRLVDTGWHALYLAELLAGRGPTEVTATAEFDPAPPFDRECFAHYRHGDVHVSLAVGTGHGPVAFEVRGEQGRLHLDFDPAAGDYSAVPRAVRLYRDGRLVRSWDVPRERGMITEGLYEEIRRRLAEGDAPYAHSVRHGRDLVATIEATYRAARERRWLPLGTRAEEADHVAV